MSNAESHRRWDKASPEDPLSAQIRKENRFGPLQDLVFEERESWVKRYRKLVCGDTSNGFLFKFELITGLAGGLPGAVGFALRKYLYKHIMNRIGTNVIFGRNISIAHSQKIRIGDNCLIADNCELNASGDDGEIVVGNNVTIGRGAFIRTKGGKIIIGDNSAIGARCILVTRNTDITIGKNHMMGAFVYIGTGSHQYEKKDIPMNRQPYIAKPVKIEEDVWIGIRATVLPGSTIRTGSVIGACSLVAGEIAPYTVAAGTPAKKIKARGRGPVE